MLLARKEDNQKLIDELRDKVSRQGNALAAYREHLRKLDNYKIERDLYAALSHAFATASSFDQLFKHTVEILSHHLKARYYGIFRLNSSLTAFEYSHGKGYKRGLMSAIPVEGSLMGECLEQKQLIWEPCLSRKSAYVPLNQDPVEYNVIVAPVQLMGRGAAVIRLANLDPESVQSFKQVLEVTVPLLSASLERLLLHDQNVRTLRGLESSFSIARLLQNTLKESDILRSVCREVPGLFACAGCVIMGRDSHGYRPLYSFPEDFRLNNSKDSWVIYLRNLMESYPGGRGLVTDIRNERRLSLPTRKVKSICMAPLVISRKLRGAIIVFGPAEETYEKSHANLLGLVASQTSMTLERAAYLRKQEDLATLDGLTGLMNHRVFQERIREEIDRARRYRHSLSLVMFDIDHFKKFNDTYGHPIGDEVIKMVSRTIKEMIRTTDLAFRYGGEEFCLLLPETAAQNAVTLAERLRKQIEQNRSVQNLAVTISLGVTDLRSGESAELLIKRADTNLYAAKQGGRNRVVQK
ncbi:MAG: diguanylate cyclase [Chitinivibrionales bacterium]